MSLSEHDKEIARRCGISLGEAIKIVADARTLHNETREVPTSHRVAVPEVRVYAQPRKPGEEW